MDIVVADALVAPLPQNFFDVVILNPPFGTKKNEGVDVQFVRRALECVRECGSVYSFHKTATRRFMIKKGEEMGAETRAAAQMRWKLSKTYRFHKKSAVDINVDVICFKKRRKGDAE